MVTLEQAIDYINKANPFMGELLNLEDPLVRYAHDRITTHVFHPQHLERQKFYKKLIEEKINNLFLPSEGVKLNFESGMIVDTSDHHGILNFPSTACGHLIDVFDTVLDREHYGDFYVLDCGNVPLYNGIAKRGIDFDDSHKHLNLFPKKDKHKLISRYPLYKFDFMEWVQKSDEKFNDEQIEFLKRFQKIVDGIDFSTCKRYSDQIVKINYYLWQEFFDVEIRDKARRCLTLEHDEILIKYLSKFLLESKDNFVWKTLFDPVWRETVTKEFDGIYGAWNYSGPNTGTHFFWGFHGDDGVEYRLVLDGNKLVNPDGKVEPIDLTPEAISKALTEGIIIPSIFTKFSLVAFYLGAKTMGGPGQTEYTGKLHKAWLNVLTKLDKDELELVKHASVMNFCCCDLAFHKDGDGNIIREWGPDIAMYHRFTKEYLERLGQTPFKYAVYPLIPISYFRFTPATERQKVEYKSNDLYQGFNWVK